MAARTLQFFCTYAENDNAAVKRSLDSIVAIVRSLAGEKEAKKQLSDYHPVVVEAVAELAQTHASYRDMVVLLPGIIWRRVAASATAVAAAVAAAAAGVGGGAGADVPLPVAEQPIEIPCHTTLRRIARLLDFHDHRTARRGAQTRNKRTLWAMRRNMHSDQTIRRLHRYEAVSTASLCEWLMTVAPYARFAYFLNERDWRAFRCVSRRLQCFTLRCAAAIETPLSLLGMVHTDENSMHCTLAYMPSYQKVKSDEKAQDKQTVKFEGARLVVVGAVRSVIKLFLRFLFLMHT
jgi:hypothetical protein